MTNIKNVEMKANELGNDIEVVKKELKRIQSVKCRLLKQKGRKDYELAMTECLKEEQLLKEVRSLIEPKEKSVPEMTKEDIERLNYDQTIKAIKSIQSKKTLTKWLTTEEGNNDEYRKACKVEEMLLEHKNNVRPIEDTTIKKTDLVKIIETIENNKDLSNERIVELLNGLL